MIHYKGEQEIKLRLSPCTSLCAWTTMRLWLIFLESKTIKINYNRYNFFLIHHQNYSFLKSTKHLYIKPIPIIPLESKTFKCKNTWHKLAHLHPIHQPPRADENERRESLEASLVIRACNQTDEYPATLLRSSADPGQTIISAETGRVSAAKLHAAYGKPNVRRIRDS